jgi:hypothetical protein
MRLLGNAVWPRRNEQSPEDAILAHSPSGPHRVPRQITSLAAE